MVPEPRKANAAMTVSLATVVAMAGAVMRFVAVAAEPAQLPTGWATSPPP